MNYLLIALYLAGIAHFGILIASANVPKALDWKNTLAPLPKMMQQMFWVYGWFIVIIIICFGTITLVHAESFAAGGNLGRWMTGMIFVFWTVRLIVQFFVFDAKPFLTTTFYKIGYQLLTLVFIFMIAVYAWATFFPGFLSK